MSVKLSDKYLILLQTRLGFKEEKFKLLGLMVAYRSCPLACIRNIFNNYTWICQSYQLFRCQIISYHSHESAQLPFLRMGFIIEKNNFYTIVSMEMQQYLSAEISLCLFSIWVDFVLTWKMLLFPGLGWPFIWTLLGGCSLESLFKNCNNYS